MRIKRVNYIDRSVFIENIIFSIKNDKKSSLYIGRYNGFSASIILKKRFITDSYTFIDEIERFVQENIAKQLELKINNNDKSDHIPMTFK